jgi:hypothetical protein
MSEKVKQFVGLIYNNQEHQAKAVLDSIMKEKIGAVLEQERVRVAHNIYNTKPTT